MSRNQDFTMGHIVRTIKILIRSRSWSGRDLGPSKILTRARSWPKKLIQARSWSGQDLDPSKILTRARSWPKKLVQARSWSGQDLDPGKILIKNKILSQVYFIQRNGQQWLLWTNTDWILLQITHRIKPGQFSVSTKARTWFSLNSLPMVGST